MADIEFHPDQQVPAGRYYVILRPVEDDIVNVQANPNMDILPPAEVPEQPNVGPAEVPNIAPPAANVGMEENNLGNGSMSMSGGKKRRNMKNMETKKAKKSKGTRKLSGYMKFAQEARPRILKENPALRSDIPGMGRKIGEMWRNLSAAEKARY